MAKVSRKTASASKKANTGKVTLANSSKNNGKKNAAKNDDESVSDDASDLGWDSDEDMIFTQRPQTDGESDMKNEDDSEEEYSEEEGGMLLSDLFSSNLNKINSSSKKTDKKVAPVDMKEDSEEDFSEDDDVSEDKDVSEDEEDSYAGFDVDVDSDEEAVEKALAHRRKFSDEAEDDYSGSDAVDSASEEDDEDDDEEDEEDDEDSGSEVNSEDEDSPEAHEKLLKAMEKFSKTNEGRDLLANMQSDMQSQLRAENGGEMPSGAAVSLSMADLLGELKDSSGLSDVRDRLKQMEKTTAAPVFVEKVVAQRLERKEVYATSKEEMGKWHETILKNRSASTLDLAQDRRQAPRYKSLVNRFVPSTSLEKEIQMVLVESGAAEDQQEVTEMTQLKARNLSLDEIKARQAELAKINALMFYEQMKRHRINKIKSKAYRAIKRKRERRANAAKGETDAVGSVDWEAETSENAEKNALERVKERMDMRHKNTSKWARMAMKHGAHDQNLRAAYHESVRLGQELMNKVDEDTRKPVDSDNEDDSDEENTTRGAVKKSRAELSDMFTEGDVLANVDGKYKKLFEMDFMRKATEQQRLRAREDAEAVLKEIALMDGENISDVEDSAGDDELRSHTRTLSEEERRQVKSYINAQLNSGGGAGFSMGMNRVELNTTEDVSAKVAAAEAAARELAEAEAAAREPLSKTEKKKRAKEEKKKAAVAANPWLDANVSGSKKARGADQLGVKTGGATDGNVLINVVAGGKKRMRAKEAAAKQAAADGWVAIPTKKAKVEETTTDSAPAKKKAALTTSSQSALVQMAFAGPDFESEFQAMKDTEIDEEYGFNSKRAAIEKDVKAGWGDWAGPGGMEVSARILAKRDKALMSIQKENETKRLERKDNKMKNVMISERRVKAQSKYKIADIPHPFTSREEYEKSLQMPVGEEWNAAHTVQLLTKPEVKTRAGRIIAPIAQPKKPVKK